MRTIFALLLLISSVATGQENVLYQLRSDGTIDRSKPSLVRQGDKVYSLRADGTVDRSGPSFVVRGKKVYTLRKDGTVDRSKPVVRLGRPNAK